MDYKHCIFTILMAYQPASALKGKHEMYPHSDFPTDNHLISYYNSLREIVRFASKNPLEVQSGMRIGLFLVNVNLLSFYGDFDKVPDILTSLIQEIDGVLQVYDSEFIKTAVRTPFMYLMDKVFHYEKNWLKGIKPFENKTRSGETWIPEGSLYSNQWKDYLVEARDMQYPSGDLSDNCLFELGMNRINIEEDEEWPTCVLTPECRDMMANGSNFGYAVTHRLLPMQVANYGVRCVVFSKSQDEALREQLCDVIYTESEFIAQNGFKNEYHPFENITFPEHDLLAEQMLLCALEGRTEFISSSWLDKILLYQHSSGCFVTKIHKKTTNESEMCASGDIIGSCHEHITGLAAGALASAMRYILQFYF